VVGEYEVTVELSPRKETQEITSALVEAAKSIISGNPEEFGSMSVYFSIYGEEQDLQNLKETLVEKFRHEKLGIFGKWIVKFKSIIRQQSPMQMI